jgi:Rad3-related DNA helicase
VIQSAGRLIRSHQDKGIIVLAGERFAQEEINQLFPSYWFEKSGDVLITEDYRKSIKDFWKSIK